MTCAWQETDTLPPVTVHVLTTGVAAGSGGAVVTDPDDRDVVRVAEVSVLVGLVVADVSSSDGVVSVAGVGVSVAAVGVEVTDVGVAVAASSLAKTWGAERMLVDSPSLKTATARHTTKLVTAVARTHDAAATPVMRRRDPISTPQS
jgi:hypothetical protein